MDNHIYCVIMAGGSGSRFWPVTRENKPIQFIDLNGDGKSLLRHTYNRFRKFIPGERILVVTLERYADAVRECLPELSEENLLREPYSRQTAPCIAYAAYTILKRDPEAVMVVTPSDHFIKEEDKFSETVLKAVGYAEENEVLMTIGIVPTGPETSFGYIQVKGGRAAATEDKPLKVKTFTEKPNADLADVFVRSGEFFWNSGIFIWSADVIREEIERFLPEVTQFFEGWEGAIGTPFEKDFIERAYGECPKVSVDYGVMEKTGRAWLYPANFSWRDLSDWDAVYRFAENIDGRANSIISAECITKDSSSNLVISTVKDKLLVLKGLENFMVIDTPDALMICPRDGSSLDDLLEDTSRPGFDKFR